MRSYHADSYVEDGYSTTHQRQLLNAQYNIASGKLVSRDNVLWKWHLRRQFRPSNLTLKSGSLSWRSEFERLVDRVPKVKVQTLECHEDEVLHVAFSHDGSEIVSCSKTAAPGYRRFDIYYAKELHCKNEKRDHRIIVWQKEKNGVYFKKHFAKDMGDFNWVHTWASQFNPSDSRLMVAGVVDNVSGEIAIFNTGREDGSRSYTLMCRVVNDPYDVLGCWCDDEFFLSGTMLVEGANLLDAQIFLCTPVSSENFNAIDVLCYKRLLFKYRNLQGTICVRYVQKHDRRKFEGIAGNADFSIANNNAVRNVVPSESDDLTESEISAFTDGQMCIVFMCGDKTKVPHQLGFQRITRESLKSAPFLGGPEKVIDFNGHVIGMAIDPQGRYLYVNVRTWPDNAVPSIEQPPPISSQIELQTVDLLTLTRVGAPLVGHRGFTPSEKAFYLYADVSDCFVGSGSEDGKGCLWDRHYGSLVSRLNHQECVNCVVLCPVDEELAITASDDKTIAVWTSARRVRKNPELSE